MEKEFVPYKLAVKLKELGFDEPCLDYFANGSPQNSWCISYNSDDNLRDFESVARPTFSQAFRWFREKYNLEITTNIIVSKSFSTLPINKTYSFVVVKTDEVSTERINKSVGMRMDIATPEELNIQALDKLIEIAKKINIGLRI